MVERPDRPAKTISRYYAVELGQVEGLTFFFYKGEVAAIHIHNKAQPSALPTYHRLCSDAQKRGVWIYVPLHKADRLLRFAVREFIKGGRVFLLGTEMAGDIIFGKPGHTVSTVIGVESTVPLTLVYGESKDDNFEIPYLGAIRKGQTGHAPNRMFPQAPWPPRVRRNTPVERRMFANPHYTSAPLKDAIEATVFYSDRTFFYCRGAMFTYKSGLQRAVGECRVGVDECETFSVVGGLCV